MVGEVVTGLCFFDIKGSEIRIQSFLGGSQEYVRAAILFLGGARQQAQMQSAIRGHL